jgi:hypothetical protein
MSTTLLIAMALIVVTFGVGVATIVNAIQVNKEKLGEIDNRRRTRG